MLQKKKWVPLIISLFGIFRLQIPIRITFSLTSEILQAIGQPQISPLMSSKYLQEKRNTTQS